VAEAQGGCSLNYYERHIGDYLKDTAHLSLLEHGVYGRLLDVYYTREAALPDAQVARLIGARSKDEIAAMRAVLAEFFVQEEGGDWIQMRCEREIERFKDKQAKAKRSADARWSASKAHSEGNANASPDAMRTHSEGNAPRARPQTPDTSLVPKVQTDRGAAKRGTRLPQDWEPGEPGMAFAAQQGLTNGRAAAEVEKFRDHWAAKTGSDATKADWQAAWRNWVRRSIEFGPKTGQQGGIDMDGIH